jgi:ferredoxin hydrogenase
LSSIEPEVFEKLLVDTDRPETYANHRKATFDHDKTLPKRKSHENPAITKIYAEFLGEPNGEKSHTCCIPPAKV